MNSKLMGIALTAIFSMSVVNTAYAGGTHDKNMKSSYEQTKKKVNKAAKDLSNKAKSTVNNISNNLENMADRISDRNMDINPYYDPSIPGSGIVLPFDEYGVTSATGAGLLDEQKRQEMLEQERLQMEHDQMMNQQSQDIDDMDTNKDMTMDSSTTTGSATVDVDAIDVNDINILDRYNVDFQSCADELSRVNGELTKNDAFYACQRYKVN